MILTFSFQQSQVVTLRQIATTGQLGKRKIDCLETAWWFLGYSHVPLQKIDMKIEAGTSR